MADPGLARRSLKAVFTLLFLGVVLLSGFFLSQATQNVQFYERWYSAVLLTIIITIALLFTIIAFSVTRLVRQYRNREMGSRLSMRLVAAFVLLSTTPAILVYGLSISFLTRGVDSWFDTQIEQTLSGAVDLTRTSLNERMRELLVEAHALAHQLSLRTDDQLMPILSHLDQTNDVQGITVFTMAGEIVADVSADSTRTPPLKTIDGMLTKLKSKQEFVTLESVGEKGLSVRTLVVINTQADESVRRIVQILYPLSERQGVLAERVQDAFTAYKNLSFIREPLKTSFVLTLSLILLQSILLAVWAALYFANRIVSPIKMLAQATRAVAVGNYRPQFSEKVGDELGVLLNSFNDMTHRVALAQDEAKQNQQKAEEQKAYFETLLVHLSSGVLSLDSEKKIQIANEAASRILGVEFGRYIGLSLEQVARYEPTIAPFLQIALDNLGANTEHWQQEITLRNDGNRQVLLCRGTLLSLAVQDSGLVLVFDDVTALIQAQKNAAWVDIARRLAHEIKNPLTPIQLSAERLRHKYLEKLPHEDAILLDKATSTIVEQVASMKEMVKAFNDYARLPQPAMELLNINAVVEDLLALYQDIVDVKITQALSDRTPCIHGDSGMIRQLLHNLLKNALDATRTAGGHVVIVTTAVVETGGETQAVELSVEDEGSGLSADVADKMYDPYFTTKAKGTGLGLAIARKIAEEHGGELRHQNLPGHGARFMVRFPLANEYMQFASQPRKNTSV